MEFIALSAYITTESSQINNLIFRLYKLGKGEQNKPKASRRKSITKIKAETSEIENRKTVEKKMEKTMKPKTDSLKRSIKLINL